MDTRAIRRKDQTGAQNSAIELGAPALGSTQEQIEEAYALRLRRSLEQMIAGDVQPVREGLAELRRELADEEDYPVDERV